MKVGDGTASDTIVVTISVTNVDEAGTVTLTNNDPPRVGTALVASVSDLDGSVSNETWQWTSSATATGSFTDIASATSASYTPVAGDVGRFLKATASYTDGEGSGKTADAVSASATQAASSTNVAPEFTEGTAATREIQETLGSATTATAEDIGAAVAATDTDTGDTLTYTLEGTDASSFGIVSTTGQLRTKAGVAYDYETDPSYSVTVKVSDSTDSDTIVVTINVSNEDEAGTVTLTNGNPPRVDTELRASLTDLDGSVSNVTWQWSSGSTAAGTFSNITGATSASYTPVTGDVGNFLKATASYTDPQGSGKTAEAVSARATQAAGTNAAPEFTEGAPATREIQETLGSLASAIEADIGAAVAATDTDTSDTLTYTLEGADASSFGIVSTSGQLQTKPGAVYDYETDTSYSVTVKVNDGTDSDTIAVIINVSNEDEAGTVTLTNDAPPRVGTALVALLTDLDGMVSNVTWQWSSASTGGGTFTDIASATSASYTPVTGDVGNFLKAKASYDDPQGTGKTAEAVSLSASATQAVVGSNNPPEFSAALATRRVAENTAAGQNIGAEVSATDDDSDTLTYLLQARHNHASFAIDPATGQLKTKDALDYEAQLSYVVVVEVSDSKDRSSILVNIYVSNEDEKGTVALTNNAPPRVGTALEASLTDPDTSVRSVTWQWSSASTATGTFTEIASATSRSYAPVTGDVGNFLKAKASYTDGEGSGKKAEAVSARATQAEGTNAAPEFTEGAPATRTIPETLGSATTATAADVGAAVAATDSDTSDTLTYTLEGTDASSFGIVSTSGQLRTKVGVAYDYETKDEYSVTVKVSDSTDSNTIDVTISVTNLDEAGAVTLSSDPPRVGTALTASLSDPDGTVSNVTWQWSSSATAGGTFSNITGATSASYTPVTGDVGNFLKATASYDDPQVRARRPRPSAPAPAPHRWRWVPTAPRRRRALRSRRPRTRTTPLPSAISTTLTPTTIRSQA